MAQALEAPRLVAPGIYVADTGYTRPRCAAAYLLRGRSGSAFVETGTALSTPRVLALLETADIRPEDVTHVIVTHVHLDHAGGAGALMQHLPNARLVVHPRGARHMIDPSKLIAGSAVVYGGVAQLEASFGKILPIPAERVIEANDGHVVDLGDRKLTFWDAPGHAAHHFVVLDDKTRGIFTGDTFGLSYRELDGARGAFIFPTTTPVQFDPVALRASIRRMLDWKPERIYFTHFSLVTGAAEIQRLGADLLRLVDELVRIVDAARGAPEPHAVLRDAMEELLMAELARHGSHRSRDEVLAVWEPDLELNAQGLHVWMAKPAKA
jgi:glyoxylase-like metal-dependent hydrolase (beta-lactamase superfamily II)